MRRPLPHIAGNPAVKPDGGMPKTDDAAQPGVPKALRNPKMLSRARARAARDDRMRYIRTDNPAIYGGPDSGGEGGGHDR